MLIVREVYSDWATERRGADHHQAGRRGRLAPVPPDTSALAKRYGVAGKILISRLKTFLQFPEWFYLKLPVNTLTEPRSTPGGLTTQFSSVGHYDLADDQAMIITVPAAAKEVAPYQGLQLGSMWYISLDYINHQTSLTADQARHDPDGMLRFVVSERDPGVANWLECTGHQRGYLQLRWQRLSRDLTAEDGPTVRSSRWPNYPSTCRSTSKHRSEGRVHRADRGPSGGGCSANARLTGKWLTIITFITDPFYSDSGSS